MDGRDHAGPGDVQRAAAAGLSVRQQADAQEGAGRHHQRPGRALPDDRGRPDRRQAQGRRLLLGHPQRRDGVDGRRAGAAAQEGDPRPLRGARGQGRKAVPAWRFEPRRAQRGAGGDLEGSHRRGRSGVAGALPRRQPDHHHRRLRRHRQLHPDSNAGRYEGPGDQPEG
ncbi:Uncharacterised protein [Mycobacterium tuberculosis]|uniref:Uncharacterized protein n=1 Tax=Mycobacterium tuberculosis TaxID=1773 RepID=A0A0U0SI89_MYCTX|nr:Uncharacterised protein [Mycobacterium tuberculosis]